MNIYEALNILPFKKQYYFKWKFGLFYHQDKQPKTEEEFLKFIGVKTLNSFLKWEKTEEYRQLMQIYLNTRFDSDLEEIYNNLSDKAKNGDEKSIKLLLQIGKDIKQYAKVAQQQLQNVQDEDDDLIL